MRITFLISLCTSIMICFSSPAVAGDLTVWIGTDLGPDTQKKGIYRATLNSDNGHITDPQRAADMASTMFITLHPDGKTLYSVCRLPGSGEGGVAAFRVSPNRQSLSRLNTQPVGDGSAAHLTVDRSGHCLFTAQYGGGSVAGFPLSEDGRIQPRTTLVKHEGSGPNKNRQKRPHAHWVGTGPDDRFLFVPDLGTDSVVVYRRNDNCRLSSHKLTKVEPGAGPRHMRFHPERPRVYLLNELTSSVTVFDHDIQNGTLEAIQTITALPESRRDRTSTAAAIRIHPNGRFLYTSNRGHDSITVFKIDEGDGTLERLELEPIRGSTPRSFHIDPSGRWLLAGGQTSNTITVFDIDRKTGKLTFTGNVVNCPAPISFVIQKTK